jgi:hypothetical protein
VATSVAAKKYIQWQWFHIGAIMVTKAKPIALTRAIPSPNRPLLTVRDCARMVGLSELSYRRAIMTNANHPIQVTTQRPALFRRAEIETFLGVEFAPSKEVAP